MATRRWRPRMSTLAWAATIVLAVGVGYSLRPQLQPAQENGATPTIQQLMVDSPVTATTAIVPPAAEPRSPKSTAPQNFAAERRAAEARPAPPADLASRDGAPAPQPTAAGRVDELGNGAVAASMQRQSAPSKAASPSAGASGVAMVEGTPVDTTVRHLAFGPTTVQAPRRITMDEAVTQLGGSIRLIDGLAPQRVELLSGVDVPGADPDRQVVRVYYEEPDLGLITLDQQRPGPSFGARDGREDRNEAATPSVTVAPFSARNTDPALGRVQVNTVAWRNDGVWLALTSHRPGVKMNELQARVK
jgi:hypothetical protein